MKPHSLLDRSSASMAEPRCSNPRTIIDWRIDMSNPEIGKSITVGRINTNYVEAGAGSPLVLIHGSGPGVTAFANWNGVIPALAPHFHVLAPDMVGFGYTDCPAEIRDFTLDLWVGHIVGFMDALDIPKAHFIGNSFGGALTLELASRHTHRVDRMPLIASAALPFTYIHL